jgi:twitching motility protein PilT
MQLLDEHLWNIYSKGLISAEEMVDKARNPGELSERVRRSGVQLARAELEGGEA